MGTEDVTVGTGGERTTPRIDFRATGIVRVPATMVVSIAETAEILKPLHPVGEAGDFLLRRTHAALTTFAGRMFMARARADYPTSRAMLLRIEEHASQTAGLLDQIGTDFAFALDYLRTQENAEAMTLMGLQAELSSLAGHARDAHRRLRPKPSHRPRLEHHREALGALLSAFETFLGKPVRVGRSRGSTHYPHLKGPEGEVLVQLIQRVDTTFTEASLARLISAMRREGRPLSEQ